MSIPRAEQTLGEGNLALPGAHSTGRDCFRHGQTQRMGFSLVFRRCDGDAAGAPDGAKAGAALAKGDGSHGHGTRGAVPATVKLPHGCICHRYERWLET